LMVINFTFSKFSIIGQCLKYSDENHEVSYNFFKFYQKLNFGGNEADSNVS
jgi:hypothetical protein